MKSTTIEGEFDVMKNLRVEVSYQSCKDANGGLRPNLTQVTRNYHGRVSTATLPECIPSATYCNVHRVLAIIHIFTVNYAQFIESRGCKGFVDKETVSMYGRRECTLYRK
jgi:hypothetical protein